jgi:Fe-S oxidoreductase
MCPSYMVTLDEKHTTRGRARVLYEMLEGDVVRDGWRSDEVHEALDLCLSCKGCKGDCPVHVDMASYKAEFLSRYYKRRLRPAAAYSMGLIMFHARMGARVPRLANFVTSAPGLSTVVKRAAGIAPSRAMPPFAHQSFRSWWSQRAAVNVAAPPVVLFADTFNDYFHPEVLKACALALESAGFRVEVPMGFVCCGRPLYDYGMLPTARLLLRNLVRRLAGYGRAGIYIVGAEPSCLATFRDELPNMLPHDEDAKRLSLQTLTLGEFLVQHAPDDWQPPQLRRRALVHGHCHQKATIGLQCEPQILERMGVQADVLDSGCCGLAGSFGFEHQHVDISWQVGEHRLLPKVREAPSDTLLIADGFSCKTQIQQGTSRRALHLGQVLAMARERGPDGPPGAFPEREYPDVRL